MQEKKSKFSEAKAQPEEGKVPRTLPGGNKESKKHYEQLQVHVSRPSEIHRWQEISVSTSLPDRRSHACCCVHKARLACAHNPDRFFVYGGVDIKEGQRDSLFSINLEGSPQEWTQHELHGDVPGMVQMSVTLIVKDV